MKNTDDVPTNLRAVKKAVTEEGAKGVSMKNGGRIGIFLAKLTGATAGTEQVHGTEFADFILDYENETIGAYL